jgi:hypothetical protein
MSYYPRTRVRIPLDVPPKLKDEFKAVTALRGEGMAPVLTLFIKSYLGANRAKLDRLLDLYRDSGEG